MKKSQPIIKAIALLIVTAVLIAGVVVFGNRKKNESSEANEDKLLEETAEPTSELAAETTIPTTEPTPEPTTEPTTTPTTEPTSEPTTEPTLEPTTEPTSEPTAEPTKEPEPTKAPYKKYEVKELTAADDAQAPIILNITKNPVLVKGNDFVLSKYISYADDVCRDVKLAVTGSVDTAVPGDYPLSLILRDDAGHETSASMNVTILAEAPEKKPGGGGGTVTKEQFGDFMANYKNENTMVGIDVSKWQDKIDFEKVAAAGCGFVMIRLGGYDDGSTYTDKFFKDNIKNAKAAGLKVGIYWHAEESSVEEVRNNVKYLLGVLDGEKLDLPVAYDWEDFSKFPSHKMSMYDLNACFEVFCDELEEAGYKACIYSSKNPLGYMWKNERNHPVWMAHYVKQSNYEGEYFMWQHSCTGRIDGINADVDLDVLYLDRTEV